MDKVAKFIDSLGAFFDKIVSYYGPWGAIGVTLGVYVLFWFFRLYTDKRKDKHIEALIAEKERTIQRLASREREYRVFFFMNMANWTAEQVNQFILRADYTPS